MRNSISLLLILLPACLVPPAGLAADLNCEEMKPRIKTLKVMNMEPRRRGKLWLEGEPATALQTSCDLYGLKTGEAEYNRKDLVRKTRFVYKSREEAKELCASVKAGEDAEDSRSSVYDFCRKNRKKDFDTVLIYDDTPATASGKPVRWAFRLYNPKGLPSEEYDYDLMAELETRIAFKYGPDGDLTERTEFGPDDKQLKRETRVLNKVTDSRTDSFFNANNILEKNDVREYREDGALRREIITAYDATEQAVGKREIAFGANDIRDTELVFGSDLDKPAYEYIYSHKFDKRGNWVEERKIKLPIFDNTPVADPSLAPEIVKREIGYFGQ